jgi:hypothetical protein
MGMGTGPGPLDASSVEVRQVVRGRNEVGAMDLPGRRLRGERLHSLMEVFWKLEQWILEGCCGGALWQEWNVLSVIRVQDFSRRGLFVRSPHGYAGRVTVFARTPAQDWREGGGQAGRLAARHSDSTVDRLTLTA